MYPDKATIEIFRVCRWEGDAEQAGKSQLGGGDKRFAGVFARCHRAPAAIWPGRGTLA